MKNYYVSRKKWLGFICFIIAIILIAPNIDPSKTLTYREWDANSFKNFMYVLSSFIFVFLLFLSKYTYLCVFRKPIYQISGKNITINGWIPNKIDTSKEEIIITENFAGQYTVTNTVNNKKYYFHYGNLTNSSEFIDELKILTKHN